MILQYDKLLPPDAPGHLDPKLREKYEEITGGMVPVPLTGMPSNTGWISKLLGYFIGGE